MNLETSSLRRVRSWYASGELHLPSPMSSRDDISIIHGFYPGLLGISKEGNSAPVSVSYPSRLAILLSQYHSS